MPADETKKKSYGVDSALKDAIGETDVNHNDKERREGKEQRRMVTNFMASTDLLA